MSCTERQGTSNQSAMCRYWQEGARGVKRTWPYDVWSAGVAWLELVLATPHVFLPSARTRARLFHQLRLGEQSPVRTGFRLRDTSN